jgi:[ribosomal protein S5]-alanine N-acetyltransferase
MNIPPYSIFPILQSERIRLRNLVPADAENAFEICYFNRIKSKDVAEAAEMIGKIEERYQEGTSIHWGIEDLATGEIIGTCGFYRGFANESAEVGYIMKEKFRRSGYMAEAVRLAVEFAFNEMQVKKVFANTAQTNLASHGVLRKNGFVAATITETGDLQFHKLR